jgi:hypothetical protein
MIEIKDDKQEVQSAGKSETSTAPAKIPTTDHRLPHEIAATILTAAYEVIAKRLECDHILGTFK